MYGVALAHNAERFWLQVIRGGRRVRVSVYDIVVGEIVPLKNGCQVRITLLTEIFLWLLCLELHNWCEFWSMLKVPADGVLIVANSLKVDEQEITGSDEIVCCTPVDDLYHLPLMYF